MTNSDPTIAKDKDKIETTPPEEAQAGPVATDEVILATAGYDHTIKFWAAHTGVCTRTLQHPDSQVETPSKVKSWLRMTFHFQVNSLEISPDGTMLAAGGYQHIRMFDLTSGNLNPVVNYEGISKNIMTVGFQVRILAVVNVYRRPLPSHNSKCIQN